MDCGHSNSGYQQQYQEGSWSNVNNLNYDTVLTHTIDLLQVMRGVTHRHTLKLGFVPRQTKMARRRIQ